MYKVFLLLVTILPVTLFKGTTDGPLNWLNSG